MSNVKRKDSKGRNLRLGESQRNDGRYVYKYTDMYGQPQFEMCIRDSYRCRPQWGLALRVWKYVLCGASQLVSHGQSSIVRAGTEANE